MLLKTVPSSIFQVLLTLSWLFISIYSHRFDGFPNENLIGTEKVTLQTEIREEITVGNQRVWLGANARYIIQSVCGVLKRQHSTNTTTNYFTWTYVIPAALIDPLHFVTEQGALLDFGSDPPVELPASDFAVLCFQRDGQFALNLVHEIFRTNPRWDPVKDEGDVAIFKLQTAIDLEFNKNLAPTIVSCDKSDRFAGAKFPTYGKQGKQSGEHDEKLGWGAPPHIPEDLKCVYVSWGLTTANYSDAPSDIYPTFTDINIYNLDQCRKKYTDVGYYIDQYNNLKFCTTTSKDSKGPDCKFDYNGLVYCQFGNGQHKRQLLVGGMTNTQEYCETDFPNVILRYAFYGELFIRAGFECCNPKNPSGCNCRAEYQHLPNIGPYFCPTKKAKI